MLHLAEADPELPVPRVAPTLNGEAEVAVPAEDGRTCTVRLITCVPGIAVSGLPERSPELYRDMGATLARLDLALSDFSHPCGSRNPSANTLDSRSLPALGQAAREW